MMRTGSGQGRLWIGVRDDRSVAGFPPPQFTSDAIFLEAICNDLNTFFQGVFPPLPRDATLALQLFPVVTDAAKGTSAGAQGAAAAAADQSTDPDTDLPAVPLTLVVLCFSYNFPMATSQLSTLHSLLYNSTLALAPTARGYFSCSELYPLDLWMRMRSPEAATIHSKALLCSPAYRAVLISFDQPDQGLGIDNIVAHYDMHEIPLQVPAASDPTKFLSDEDDAARWVVIACFRSPAESEATVAVLTRLQLEYHLVVVVSTYNAARTRRGPLLGALRALPVRPVLVDIMDLPAHVLLHGEQSVAESLPQRITDGIARRLFTRIDARSPSPTPPLSRSDVTVADTSAAFPPTLLPPLFAPSSSSSSSAASLLSGASSLPPPSTPTFSTSLPATVVETCKGWIERSDKLSADAFHHVYPKSMLEKVLPPLRQHLVGRLASPLLHVHLKKFFGDRAVLQILNSCVGATSFARALAMQLQLEHANLLALSLCSGDQDLLVAQAEWVSQLLGMQMEHLPPLLIIDDEVHNAHLERALIAKCHLQSAHHAPPIILLSVGQTFHRSSIVHPFEISPLLNVEQLSDLVVGLKKVYRDSCAALDALKRRRTPVHFLMALLTALHGQPFTVSTNWTEKLLAPLQAKEREAVAGLAFAAAFTRSFSWTPRKLVVEKHFSGSLERFGQTLLSAGGPVMCKHNGLVKIFHPWLALNILGVDIHSGLVANKDLLYSAFETALRLHEDKAANFIGEALTTQAAGQRFSLFVGSLKAQGTRFKEILELGNYACAVVDRSVRSLSKAHLYLMASRYVRLGCDPSVPDPVDQSVRLAEEAIELAREHYELLEPTDDVFSVFRDNLARCLDTSRCLHDTRPNSSR